LKFDDGLVLEGTSDEQGAIKFPYSEISLGHYSLELLPKDSTPQAKPAEGKK
jgi:hypothetical protein